MKGAVFAVGIILLVMAFALFFLGYSIASKNASYGVFGDLAQLFSSDYAAAAAVRQGYWMELFGGILGIAGLGACVYGAVSQPRMRAYARTPTPAMQTVEHVPSENVSYCWKCGTKFKNQDDRFCYACGSPKTE